MPDSLAQLLMRGLDDLGFQWSEESCAKMLAYRKLLEHWGKTINLTAVMHPSEMITRHLLDSLSIATYVQEQNVVDMGTGAGLPGIPLAIMQPWQSWCLVDTNGKKVSFLREAVRQLKLQNVQVVKSRIENFKPEFLFPAATARAFASLSEIADNAAGLRQPGGQVWAMKGRYPTAELENLPPAYSVVGVRKLLVPGLQEDRHLVQLEFNPDN